MKERNFSQEAVPSSVENLSQAIFTVNRHAKTAPNPKFLYQLKKKSLEKLIETGKAKKIGLHFSRNPKMCQQRSDVLVRVGEYTFHIPPIKKDFKELPHLGELDEQTRNPKSKLNLHQSKALLIAFTGLKEPNIHASQNKYQKPVFKRLGSSY